MVCILEIICKGSIIKDNALFGERSFVLVAASFLLAEFVHGNLLQATECFHLITPGLEAHFVEIDHRDALEVLVLVFMLWRLFFLSWGLGFLHVVDFFISLFDGLGQLDLV